MVEVGKLTRFQVAVLRRLNDLRTRSEMLGGVNPISFGGESAAACARRLATKGYVWLDRISERHIRYSITESGRQALLAGER